MGLEGIVIANRFSLRMIPDDWELTHIQVERFPNWEKWIDEIASVVSMIGPEHVDCAVNVPGLGEIIRREIGVSCRPKTIRLEQGHYFYIALPSIRTPDLKYLSPERIMELLEDGSFHFYRVIADSVDF